MRSSESLHEILSWLVDCLHVTQLELSHLSWRHGLNNMADQLQPTINYTLPVVPILIFVYNWEPIYLLGKKLSSWLSACAFLLYAILTVFVPFPFLSGTGCGIRLYWFLIIPFFKSTLQCCNNENTREQLKLNVLSKKNLRGIFFFFQNFTTFIIHWMIYIYYTEQKWKRYK